MTPKQPSQRGGFPRAAGMKCLKLPIRCLHCSTSPGYETTQGQDKLHRTGQEGQEEATGILGGSLVPYPPLPSMREHQQLTTQSQRSLASSHGHSDGDSCDAWRREFITKLARRRTPALEEAEAGLRRYPWLNGEI